MTFSFSLTLVPEWIREMDGRALVNVRQDCLQEGESFTAYRGKNDGLWAEGPGGLQAQSDFGTALQSTYLFVDFEPKILCNVGRLC